MFDHYVPVKLNIPYFGQSILFDYPGEPQNIGAWNWYEKNQDQVTFFNSSQITNYSKDDFVTPFVQENILEVEENQVLNLIFDIKRTSFISNREIISRKLLNLYFLEKEEGLDGFGITIGSLRNFYHFLQLYSNIKIPMISLTPDATIYTSWKEHDHLFSINFLSDGEVRFVVFKPNDTNPKHKIRLSGSATADTIMELISTQSLCDWIFG